MRPVLFHIPIIQFVPLTIDTMNWIHPLLFLVVTFVSLPQSHAQDWANLGRYAAANQELNALEMNEKRVVFMGNSITEGWGYEEDGLFARKPYINRGISGQTTPQMLIRFRRDVIELEPAVVVILAGINDIAGNTGPTTIDVIFGNIVSMIELARANDITVVLCSVLPAGDFSWSPGLDPAKKVVELNTLLETYAKENDIVYVDYFRAMADDRQGLPLRYSEDGVHPNSAGYRVMTPLVEAGIEEALGE